MATATGAAIVALSTVTIGAPAHARDDARVVDRSNTKMPALASDEALKGGESITVLGTIPLPAGVKLRAGETIKVVYADGELIHQADKAGCTRTYGAHDIASGRPISAMHSLGVGSGCSNPTSTTGYLWAYDGWIWGDQLKASKNSGRVPVGSTRYFFTEYVCSDPYTTTWTNRTGAPTEAEISRTRTCY